LTISHEKSENVDDKLFIALPGDTLVLFAVALPVFEGIDLIDKLVEI